MKKFIVLIATALCFINPVLAADFRAGNIGFPAGSAGITVTFATPMPNAKYAVTVQPTNTAGYSSTNECTYFNVLKKTATKFEVQHKTCIDGTPVELDVNVSLNWIVSSYDP